MAPFIIDSKGTLEDEKFPCLWGVHYQQGPKQTIQRRPFVKYFRIGKSPWIDPYDEKQVKLYSEQIQSMTNQKISEKKVFVEIIPLPTPFFVGLQLTQLSNLLNTTPIPESWTPIYRIHTFNGKPELYLWKCKRDFYEFEFCPFLHSFRLNAPYGQYEFTNQQEFKLFKNPNSSEPSVYKSYSCGLHNYHTRESVILSQKQIQYIRWQICTLKKDVVENSSFLENNQIEKMIKKIQIEQEQNLWNIV